MTAASRNSFESPCGRIVATEPSGVPGDLYWRLQWTEDGKRRQTSGGRTHATATAKVKELVDRLDANMPRHSRTKLGEVRTKYLQFVVRKKATNHAIRVPKHLAISLDGLDDLRCEDLARHHLRPRIDRCTSENTAREVRSATQAFLAWAHRNDYLTSTQAAFLETYDWTPPPDVPVRARREFAPPPVGETKRFVTPDRVPSLQQVKALAIALQEELPWGELLVELGAQAGHRSGELFANTIDEVDLETNRIEINWQVLQHGKTTLASVNRLSRLARPKGGNVRVTNFAAVTLTGYPLHEALEKRIAEVRQERELGLNPMGLLFPAKRGGWVWNTSFTNDHLHQAQLVAGWPYIDWVENGQARRLWRLTLHSLRHRFARDRIDVYNHKPAELMVVGGWASPQVVYEKYYGISDEDLDNSSKKLLPSG